MTRYRLNAIVCVGAVVLAGAPAFGQSQTVHGNSASKSNGKGNGNKTPNQSPLPPPTGIAGPAAATPFAWVDNAAVMTPGTVWIGTSMVNLSGGGLSEVSAPVIDAAVGLAKRAQ